MREADTIERENIKEIGPLRFDLDRRSIHGPRGRCMLAPLNFAVLERLARRPGVVVSYSDIVQSAWEDPDKEPDNPELSIRVVIKNMRGLFCCMGVSGRGGVEIKSEPGVGYWLKYGGRD